jgi:Ni/Fe-hydrogenase subunit HybB-like protein
MSAAHATPVGGKLVNRTFLFLLLLWALGSAAGLVRFTQGLGAASGMNDGFPWGIWIAVDVVVGTALGSGGFAVAMLIYVLNRGRYHPLIRPALLTAALGYTAGATAIVFDVGRYWNLWRVPIAPLTSGGRFIYNWNSGLLEVALCVMAYTAVLWIEVSPPILARWREEGPGPLKAVGALLLPLVRPLLPVVLALGLVLPMMHQSTLGSLYLVSVTKLHKLWHTPLLPLFFLITCVGMGYAAVVLEAVFSAWSFKRRIETELISELTRIMAWLSLAFVVVRLADVTLRGRLPLAFSSGFLSLVFWAELALALAAAGLLWGLHRTSDAGALVRAAAVLVAAGGLYRVDVYLTAFDPGNGWHYFPAVGEILVTLGILAVETMVFIFVVRRYPILAGAPLPGTTPAPAASAAGGRP